jgi:DNA invertase Pin-like site-specific DNA recombinase
MKKFPPCPLPPGSLVWSYLRVSGDEQADSGLPIAGQRQYVQDYVDRNQLVIAGWFIDEARPGNSTAKRDAFNEMIEASRRKPRPVDGIIVWSLSRFARNLQDSQFYKADLRRRGYTLLFLSDDIPDGDIAPIVETLLEWKAQKDRVQMATDIQRGLHMLARMGYAPGGFPPRGYKAETVEIQIEGKSRQVRRWVPDPDMWDLARKAWEMRAAGNSILQVHEETHLFHAKAGYSSFFRNKTYLGVRLCGDLEIPNAHEALITQEMWDRVQMITDPRPMKGQPMLEPHPRRVNSRFLLSGLLYCSVCGSAMCGEYQQKRASGHNEWSFYICNKKVRLGKTACPNGKLQKERLERAVLSALLDRVLTPDQMQHLLDEVNAALARQTEGIQRG